MGNKMIKGALAGLVLVLVAAAVLVVNAVWFRPFSLNVFYEKALVQAALSSPELLTSLGLVEQVGYRRHNAHLDDVSQAQADRDAARTRATLADLNAYNPAGQTAAQRLSTQVLRYFLESEVEADRYRLHNFPVNQLEGVQSQTVEFLIHQHQIDDLRGAEDYLSRLGEMGRKFDQVLDGLALREQKGIVPPRFVIDRVLAEMRAFATKPVQAQPLYTHLADRLGKIPSASAADRQALLARCARLLQGTVLPAYGRLIEFFEAQRGRAGTDDGVWRLPDGAAFYAWRLQQQTTSRMTPDQVHALGLAEVARIDAEMQRLLAAQHELQPGETAAQALQRLALDTRFLYPDTYAGRAAALADYQRMLADQLQRSRALFGRVPAAAIEVQRVPAFKEQTAPGAYYQPPPLDGSRPGVFFVNLRRMAELPKFGMRTLAVHEGVPGHHFQIALAMEQAGGPTFRRVLPFTAYAEGWALYAEWLASEMGLYQGDPFGDLGRLQAEMFRAVRLVVDTGIHAQRWTRERAIAYMQARTGMSEGEVVAEIERYIVDPGQACAYKVGMLSIRAARNRAQAALGPRFDAQALKDFHDLVLAGGALPLAVLDEQVDAWIAQRTIGAAPAQARVPAQPPARPVARNLQ